jgi:pimeloyl-ACP methyl ester carboxylesterase
VTTVVDVRTAASPREVIGPSRTTRRPTPPALLGVGYLLAMLVLSAGFGVAAPHLGKEGVGLTSLLGLAAIAIGGLAALWSGWRLLRGTRPRWWLLAVPALVVTAYLALWTVGQGVAAAYPAHPALGSRTPADVGLRYETVTLRTSDDVRLAAWWVPGTNGAAVVLLHGAGSTRTNVLDQAAVLGSHGYGVLLLDARGHGESEGRGMDFGWYGERDVDAALDFLDTQPTVATGRVGVVGLSMGGEVAIGAAGADTRVRAVVAEGATNRVAADKGYLAAYGWRGWVQQRIDWVTYAVAGLLSGAPEPAPLRDSVVTAQTDGSPTPILLITAGDVDTERLAAERLRRAAPVDVEVWTVPDAGHTAGLRTSPAQWQQRVLAFLDAGLLATPR